MNESGVQLGNYGIKVDIDSIHLDMYSGKSYNLSTWSIQNFSTIRRVISKGFQCKDHSTYFIYLRHDQRRKRITIEYTGSFNRFIVVHAGCFKFDVAISTDSGAVMFNKILCNARPLTSSLQYLFRVDLTGEDFKKLKHLPNDTFILTCRIKSPGIRISSLRNIHANTSVNNCVNIRSLQNDIFLGALPKETVELCVDNEKEIVNKSLLCARSPVFARMFQNDTREQRENKVVITDNKMPVLRALVAYVSSGIVSDGDFDFFCDLYYAADKYNIMILRQECVKFLLCRISHENILRVLKLSLLHNDELLKSAVTALISVNIDTIKMTSEWNNFMHDDPDLALKASTVFDY